MSYVKCYWAPGYCETDVVCPKSLRTENPVGMNNKTGYGLDDLPHIRQSVSDILTTPIGSRVMRRDYGSYIPSLIDHPANGANRLRIAAASYAAIRKWEPRIVLTRVGFELGIDGKATIEIEAMRAEGPNAGQSINLNTQVIA